MVASFLNERSVEFCLVPRLCRLLSDFRRVTPIYFWRTREGSRLGFESDNGASVRVLAMYARRPKMSSVGDDTISMKINAYLRERVSFLANQGIPAVFGVPLASSLLDFQLSVPCIWFKVHSEGKDSGDIVISMDASTGSTQDNALDGSASTIQEDEILCMVRNAAQFRLTRAIEIMGQKLPVEAPASWWFRGVYKPVYFLIQE